jgi:formate C-acetyltransferase
MRDLLDVIDREATNEQGLRDVLTLNVTINDMNHLWQGGAMAATVDGRLAGTPLSENLSPTVGYAQSVTQLLNSVAKLPFDRIHSGALNVRLRRDAVRGKAGLIRLKALIETYFEQGGMQLQISIADTEELRRAQQCPENYGDLSVRITGYSAIFVDMSPTAQEEFIRRDELG